MKRKIMVAAALFLGTLASGSVLAAQEITKEQANQYQEVGKISSMKEQTAPSDAKADLSKKADELGGKYYVITSAKEGSKMSATATVYK